MMNWKWGVFSRVAIDTRKLQNDGNHPVGRKNNGDVLQDDYRRLQRQQPLPKPRDLTSGSLRSAKQIHIHNAQALDWHYALQIRPRRLMHGDIMHRLPWKGTHSTTKIQLQMGRKRIKMGRKRIRSRSTLRRKRKKNATRVEQRNQVQQGQSNLMRMGTQYDTQTWDITSWHNGQNQPGDEKKLERTTKS